ncbi:MAG: hypothetical protein EOO12_03090 [Chitinophagaceae bacterium]|nr:MAG: hypothetical protein EOO12_03090 [Chitinophagaceae bacterium]
MQEENKRGGTPPEGRDQEPQEGSGSQQQQHSDETPIYLTSNSTLQTEAEHLHDQSVDPRQDRTIDVNRDDQHEIRAGRLTGRDETDNDPNTTA